MSKTKTVIEINGKRYNAVTGEPIHSAKTAQPRPISDIVRPAAHPSTTLQPHKATLRPASPKRPANHTKTHKPEGSKTLMRQAVHKPATTKRLHAQTAVALPSIAPTHTVAQKVSFHQVDTRRERHAKTVAQNKLISRFGDGQVGSNDARPLQPSITVPAPTSAYQVPTKPAEPAAKQPSADLFERAIQHARSHEQTFTKTKHVKRHKHPASRIASVSSMALAVLVLGAFLLYQNMANIQLKVASSKAGFAASLPGYKPAGFSVGKFNYQPGSVAINFASNSDQRHFSLVEKVSGWDSTALFNEFVATASNGSQQTVQSAGRTIYVYGQGNATWVSGGVWYQVHNAADLSTTQLVKLASSM